MTQVYMIANLKIEDAETYRKYEKGFFPILKKHGGSFITYDDAITHLEGSTPVEGRVVMWTFLPKKLRAAGLMMPTIRLCQNFAAPVHRSPRLPWSRVCRHASKRVLFV